MQNTSCWAFRTKEILIILFFSFLISSCGTKVPYYGNSSIDWSQNIPPEDTLVSHAVYMLGNIDLQNNNVEADEIIDVLHSSIDSSNQASNTLVILGDLYKNQLSDSSLNSFLKNLRQRFEGDIYFVPGDKDWNAGASSGQKKVSELENKIESEFDGKNVFMPSSACPGPKEVMINDHLVLIFLDSQWWLHNHEKPKGQSSGCKSIDKFSYILNLEKLIDLHEDKNILIVQHHPLFSNGHRGGFFSLKDHIFPLTTFLNKNLYLPLPLIGSAYPILRYLGIDNQDIEHPDYKEMKKELLSVLEDRKNVTLVAAHDYNLQYRKYKELHHVVSGASTSTDYTQSQNEAEFVYQNRGFARIKYYESGESWLEFVVHSNNPNHKIAYRTNLNALNPDVVDLPDEDLLDYTDSTNTIPAGVEYKAGKLKKFFLGAHYRKEWIQPVELPLLDFARHHGGLEITKKGGGNQTISMEAIDSSGLIYDIRSVNKDPKGAVPSPLLNTFAQDVVQDQISSAHPYGALAIPKMEEALGLYYQTPELYQIPNTPLLGQYYDDFAGMMVLKQIELDEDLSEFDQFGNSENVVGENTLYEHLREDNDNEFDEKMFIKARLFDMVIGDWDRHDGQWGFAEFEKEDKGSLFKPIAKDRDQVFAKFDGLLPYLASRKWAVRKFSHFSKDFGDIIGLNFNGRYVDRRLLSSLEWKDWEMTADIITRLLTDDVIDASLMSLPPEVYPISGPEISSKIKSRRSNIKKAAREYYEVLAKEVDIIASDKHEFFQLQRLDNGNTRVQCYKTKKEGNLEKKLFDREFISTETDEIRIYTREGNDSIFISGNGKKSILIRIIGGPDKDVIIDETSGKNIIVYDDNSKRNKFTTGEKAKVKTSNRDDIYEYDMEAFKYDYAGPGFMFELNPDDGIYLGGGIKLKKYGFRKEPAKSEHSLLASVAFATGAYNAEYKGTFYSLFARNLDLGIKASSFGPKFVFNYFGQGNDTKYEGDDIDFYRVRIDNANLTTSINYRFNRFLTVGAGPHLSYFYARDNEETILRSLQFDQPEEIENAAYFTGVAIFADLVLVDHPANPSKGIVWHNKIQYNKQLNDKKDEFTYLSTDVSLYYTPRLPIILTLAVRFGLAANMGDYKFYQSNFLGGSSNLRGFRRTRFAGQTIMFNNTELRLEISEINNYIFTGKWGLTGFVDNGRVWSELNQSNEWHRSVGPGVWLNAFELLLVSANYGFSDEGGFFNLRLGHFF